MANIKRNQEANDGPIGLLHVGIVIGICLMLVTTPWFFGGVAPWVHCVLLGVSAVLLLAETIRTFIASRSGAVVVVPATAWLLFGGIALGMFQLMPLNEDGASKFAAGSVRWHQDARLENASEPTVRKVARSLYPPSTRENVALLLLVTAVFWLSSCLLYTSPSPRDAPLSRMPSSA